MKTKLLSFLLITGCIVVQAQENKILNGGFEIGELQPNPNSVTHNYEWYSVVKNTESFQKGTLEYSSESSREGLQSLKLTCNYNPNDRYSMYVAQSGLALEKKIYTVTLFAKSDKEVQLAIQFYGYEGDTQKLSNDRSITISGDNNWHSYSIDADMNSLGTNWDYDKPIDIRIALAKQDLSGSPVNVYVDDVYVKEKTNEFWVKLGNYSFEGDGSTTTSIPGWGVSKPIQNKFQIISDDVIQGNNAFKSIPEEDGGYIELYPNAANTPIPKDKKIRVTFYAKSATTNPILQPFFFVMNKGAGMGKNANNLLSLSNRWEKYSVIYNFDDPDYNADQPSRLRFALSPQDTYLDFITIDEVSNSRYITPEITGLPSTLSLDKNQEGIIQPDIISTDYIFCKATSPDTNLTIEKYGRTGFKVSSAKDGIYTLNITYTDNITKTNFVVEITVGNGENIENNSNTDHLAYSDKGNIIIKGEKETVSIYDINGSLIDTRIISNGVEIISVPTPGIYLVRISEKTYKVLVN